ncbi:MAG: transporter substrate-binding domain-containing protein [Muribaculaceae bacterium]|nr:transporter substrate-binding domain-containing protein [Muribaculaceae bacterium]
MKRILTLLLALVLAAGMLVACGGGESTLLYGKDLLAVATQLDALNGLTKGDADIAVIDSVMANYYMNQGGETYAGYEILKNVVLKEEEYGIGAKKGNDALIGKINEALIALVATDYQTVAATYGLTSELLVKADTANPKADATDGSWDAVVASKKLVIGYTKFAPIAYDEGDGADAKLVGFDIDLARAVVAYLNATYSAEIEIEFVVIDWNSKEKMLETGDIDLVWNGMTITPERSAGMAMSVPYLANKQVAVVESAKAADYGSTLEEFKYMTADCIFVVEAGSAGQEIIKPVE